MEEAKTQENAKLQSALQEMELKFKETKEMLMKEQESVRKVVEKVQVIQEIPVIDTAVLDKLTAENEKLKADMEEAKTQENAKLQSALLEMELKFKESKEMPMKEQESAKKVVEKVQVIQEIPVIDTAVLENLIAENEKLKADMEEAKTQENAKLQSALQEMELKFKETKEVPMKEQEAAKKAVEKVQVIQEIPVIDTAVLDKLTAENEKLKAMVSSLEEKIDETEKKFEETQRLSEERLKQAMEAESKIIQLKTKMQSLEEKLSDMECEDQILRQEALLNAPVKQMSQCLAHSPIKNLENGHYETEELKAKSEPQSAPSPNKDDAESVDRLRRSYIERQHENFDALVKCVSQNIGFSQGKPVAAFTIYKCLLQWKSFEAERTSIFDRLIEMVGSAIEHDKNHGDEENVKLAYWLSNTSNLLFLLQRSLKPAGATGAASPQRKPPPATSLFGRMAQGFRSSSSLSNLPVGVQDVIRQVEAKYPALLFKQQLTAYVEKIYGIIRDKLKIEVTQLVAEWIQAPKSLRSAMLRVSGRSVGNKSQSTPLKGVIACLNATLKALIDNHVPLILIQKIFTQVFSSINVQLFNGLLLRRESLSFTNGEYVKGGIADLEMWCSQEGKEYAGSSWDELKNIRQAVGFLVIHNKKRISYDEITNDLCPTLTVQQLHRICTNYWDDSYGTTGVDSEVISTMRILMTEESDTDVADTFLLEDYSSIPFSIDDLSNSLQEKDFSDVKPAALHLDNPAFQFLQE